MICSWWRSEDKNFLTKLCNRVDYFKHEKAEVKIMATLFEKYVAEERDESLKRDIKGIVKTCRKFGQSDEMAKESVLEEYPDIN